jgi:hypothetical protein
MKPELSQQFRGGPKPTITTPANGKLCAIGIPMASRISGRLE